MFNFHKPRTYRSSEGCCICKAKSSSSRFTDSRKYEEDIVECFQLKYPRQGEICNACVLLVKRFKRLPVGSKRNWSHIVDAKAGIGPGYNKIHPKYKSERINSRTATQQHNASASYAANSSNTFNGASANSLNGISSYIPEKFTKIYKKTKKGKEFIVASHSAKRKSNNWLQNDTNCLPNANDSLDSDYEDTKLHGSINGAPSSNSTAVEFQTQTRASAHKAQAAAKARKRIIQMGTKRRKCLPPRKYCRSMAYEESIPFFDEEEWQECKSCCGMFYECAALARALLIDIKNYKPCEKHQKIRAENAEELTTTKTVANNDNNKTAIAQSIQQSIIKTVPVQSQLPQGPPPSASVTSSLTQSNTTANNSNNFKMTTTTTTPTPTPVLKKHHLFFKRQSECFPQGDMVTNNNNTTASTATQQVVNIIKTEPEVNLPQQQNHSNLQQKQSTTKITNLQKHNENAIHSSSSAANITILTNPVTSSAIGISVASSSASINPPTISQMHKHSLAKLTTTSSLHNNHYEQHHQYSSFKNSHNSTSSNLVKPNTFLHKVKADTGKIVKHSLDKFNTAVRLKTSDIQEMKPIIRAVDKSYILAKPPTEGNIINININNNGNNNNINSATTYQSLESYKATAQPPLTTSSHLVSSPKSSTSSPKFSDNSSDSGFDENLLDRKSASPMQEDCEKKIQCRPVVQTMFLANGLQVQGHGQSQNLLLTGNEVAAKILQNRKYSSITTSTITANPRSLTTNHNLPTTAAVKIAQIPTTPLTSSTSPSSSSCSATQAKMRAIYNNTIQHENGITTIVPASSLAATTQTAAMQNIAPSTVTITPAPPIGTQFNTQNVISRKLTTTNIINLQSNTTVTNLSNSYNTNGNYLHHQQNHLSSNNNNNIHNNATNQKIILLKTSTNNTTTLTANYNTQTGASGILQHGSGGAR